MVVESSTLRLAVGVESVSTVLSCSSLSSEDRAFAVRVAGNEKTGARALCVGRGDLCLEPACFVWPELVRRYSAIWCELRHFLHESVSILWLTSARIRSEHSYLPHFARRSSGPRVVARSDASWSMADLLVIGSQAASSLYDAD